MQTGVRRLARGNALQRGAHLALRGRPNNNPAGRRARGTLTDGAFRAAGLPAEMANAAAAAFFARVPVIPFPREPVMQATNTRCSAITSPILLELGPFEPAENDDGG